MRGLNEIVRDRSVSTSDPTEIIFWTTDDDIRAGDEVCGGVGATPEANAAAYDVICNRILKANFTETFVTDGQAKVARHQELLTAHETDMLATMPDFMRRQGEAIGSRLQVDLSNAQSDLLEIEAEALSIETDLAAGKSVRVERLKDSSRPGRTIGSADDCLLGESVCDHRDTLP